MNKMQLTKHLFCSTLSLLITSSTFAAESIAPQPVLSSDGGWAGVMMIVVAGLFLAAAVIGPIIRVEIPREVPPTHSHDEPPGSSHHHGRSGIKM